MSTTSTIVIAILGGILPAIVWLKFWLREDKLHPEPRRAIVLTFIGGMLVIPIAILLERMTFNAGFDRVTLIIIWSFIEEALKFVAAYVIVLRTKNDDEPIDPIIYLITTALGFAAIENALFLMTPLLDGQLGTTIVTGNLRFVGATLLHVLSSASIGVWLAYSFYKNNKTKLEHLIGGLFTAVALHAVFNFFIMNGDGKNTLIVFAGVWIAVIGLMLIIERVKKIHL